MREALLDEDRLWSVVNRRTAEAMTVRETLEMSLTALQLRVQKERDKISRLLDLYAADDLDRATYLAKRKAIEDSIASLSEQINDLERRIDDNPVSLPEQEEALRAFQRKICGSPRRQTEELEPGIH